MDGDHPADCRALFPHAAKGPVSPVVTAPAPSPAPARDPVSAKGPAPGDPQDTTALRKALGWFATGVTIATTLDAEGRPVGLTCNSFNSVSLDPPLVLWSLGRSAYSRPWFERTAHFAINVLPTDAQDLARRFATPLENKWSGVAWTQGRSGVPCLPQALASFECRVRERFQGGDHLIFLGEIEAMASRDDGEPLVFLRGGFGGFAPFEAD
jgi:flavin reductase (DIM6/NTAB) family NADH-FMN oxidoreductase RutF